MSQGQNSLQGDSTRNVYAPYYRATKLYRRSFDHGSYVEFLHFCPAPELRLKS